MKALPLLASLALGLALNGPVRAARETTPLDPGWRFQAGDPADASAATFDDRAWPTLHLPHNWGWELAQQGKDYQRGPGWYRQNLGVGAPQPGRRYFVRFEAAGSVADVYLNNHLLGSHRGAFGAFCFELTPALARTGPNVLAVRVSNAPEADVAPLSGDFPVYGGLYRSVALIETDDVCFTPLDHGSPGVAWRQTSVSAGEAALDVTAQISNGSRTRQPVKLVTRVVDATGRTVATAEQSVVLAPMATAPYSGRLTVPQPHLWNGRKDPYLYRAIVELCADDGRIRDTVGQPLGLRSFALDPDRGFILNGQPYPLHGVNRHQDRPDKGWAISEADQDEDLKLILEMGCTAIRCSHYQHSEYFYRRCDELGLLVWAEIPLVDKIGDDPRFAETSRGQLIDLIRQNLNHPAIFTWSLFNELRPGTRNPDPHRLLQDLQLVAHGEDPTRPTVAATATEDQPQLNRIPDVLGWNVYYGWYADWGPLAEFDPMRAGYRPTSRAGGYCVSEYGAGANVSQHEDNPAKPKNDGQWHPEEYQSLLHEAAWPQLKAAPYIWGTFIWTMFDFTSYWRHEGGVVGRNDKGLVTADRQTRKDAFYYYKANWSEEPTLYLTSRRFTDRTAAVTDVKVYANTGEVELFVNGRSQGRQRDNGNRVFVWPKVSLTPGENRLEARATHNGLALTDSCVWTLKPAAAGR